jgi:uncharacterized protein YlxW (UPF0749 family)
MLGRETERAEDMEGATGASAVKSEKQRWAASLPLAVLCLGLGVLLVAQLRTQQAARQTEQSEDWSFVVADLVDSNARLRAEVATLQSQLAGLEDVGGGGVLLQSLVDEVNHLRIVNGRVEVSGPGVEVLLSGPISVLDLQDLINELRNAGAEALALNGRRLVAWSAISFDGQQVTVDGQPAQAPYRLQAIGDATTLEVALLRPGGLVDLLYRANAGISISVEQQDKMTLPIYDQPFEFVYAKAVR